MRLQTIIVFFVIVSISIISFIAFYFHIQKRTLVHPIEIQKRNSSKYIIQPIPTGIGDQNNLTTWSRYTYNHEFSIAYPPYWNVVPDQDGNGVSFMTTGFHQDDDFSMPYGNSNEVVFTLFGQNDTSDMKLRDGDQFPSDTTPETMVVTNLQHLKIGGFPAVEFDYYPTDNTNFLATRMSILMGNRMYRFNALYAQDAGKQSFEEMMQSLKFIEE